jgi:CheY-like chemotaxis protein
MPYMNGIELIERLKANDEPGEMVLLAAMEPAHTQVRATELGVRCVHRPVTAESAAKLVELLSN